MNIENNASSTNQKPSISSSNRFNEIDLYKDVTVWACREIERVHTTVKYAITITALAAAIISFFTYKSLDDYKNELLNDFQKFQIKTQKDAQNYKSDIDRELVKQVNEAFDHKNINQIINDVTSERINAITNEQIKKAIKDILDPTVIQINKDIDQKVNFILTILKGNADDKEAFELLNNIALNKDDPYSPIAQSAVNTIIEQYNTSIIGLSPAPAFPWGKEIDPSKLTKADLFNLYNSNIPHQLEPNLLAYICQRNDFNRAEKLDFLVEAMNKTKSLRTVDRAVRLFQSVYLEGKDIRDSELNVHGLSYTFITDFWNKNKNNN